MSSERDAGTRYDLADGGIDGALYEAQVISWQSRREMPDDGRGIDVEFAASLANPVAQFAAVRKWGPRESAYGVVPDLWHAPMPLFGGRLTIGSAVWNAIHLWRLRDELT